jgi:hypothetical protein
MGNRHCGPPKCCAPIMNSRTTNGQAVASEGRACRVRRATLDCPSRFIGPLEGPACQGRCATLDHPLRFGGHDERAPPVRYATFDYPSRFIGRDNRAPPNGYDKHASDSVVRNAPLLQAAKTRPALTFSKKPR